MGKISKDVSESLYKELCRKFKDLKISHVPSRHKKVADILAKEARRLDDCIYVIIAFLFPLNHHMNAYISDCSNFVVGSNHLIK